MTDRGIAIINRLALLKSLLYIILSVLSLFCCHICGISVIYGKPASVSPYDSSPSDTPATDPSATDSICQDTVATDTVPVDSEQLGPGGIPVHPEWPYTMASRTIPLLHINTDGLAPILDKINYLDAGCWLEVPDGQERWEALGSPDNPVSLEIRGRGNHTWYNLPKKAYKLKFSKKTSVLGMSKNKHYALICYDPFYASMWLAPLVGMQVSRLVQPVWVPRMQPVEVVLNGEYRGLYLLVESIKIASDRLDITVQEEESDDPETVSSGWLVELDNQDDEYQISIPAQNKVGRLRVTYKEPELLSPMQLDWLTTEFTHLNELIENPLDHPDDPWTDHFDVPSIARYMIIRELLHDVDGYSGSQYFHRDLGADKWVAGPMWDMEIWSDPKPDWIWDHGRWSILNWIPFMRMSPRLNDAFVQEWDKFYNGAFQEIFSFIDDIEATYSAADTANTLRWPEENYSLEEKVARLRYNLRYNALWIDARKHWDYQISVGVDGISVDDATRTIPLSLSGTSLTCCAPAGGATLEIILPDGSLLTQSDLPRGESITDLRLMLPEGFSGMMILRVTPSDSRCGVNSSLLKCVIS